MPIRNVTLGICAACLAVGSAAANVLNATIFLARRNDGLAYKEFTVIANPCPSAMVRACKVKLKTANGVNTRAGYSAATVYTAAGLVVVMTESYLNEIPVILVQD